MLDKNSENVTADEAGHENNGDPEDNKSRSVFPDNHHHDESGNQGIDGAIGNNIGNSRHDNHGNAAESTTVSFVVSMMIAMGTAALFL